MSKEAPEKKVSEHTEDTDKDPAVLEEKVADAEKMSPLSSEGRARQKVEAEKSKKKSAFSANISIGKLSIQDKINFARHLAMVIKAGLPVFEGLSIIKNQAESRLLKRILDQVLKDVENGRFLADSLDRHKRIFGDFFINVVRVGEASGTLAQNLLYLADELKKAKDLKSKVRSAMVYPAIILVATLGVVGFLTFFVFPKLLVVFSGLNVELPPTTRAVIATIDYIKNYGLYTLGALIIGFFGAKAIIKRVEPLRRTLHRILLFVPVLSGLVISINVANFARILGLLLKSGVKIVEAITITANTFENLVYRQSLYKATEEIRRGEQLAHYLTKHKRIFPLLASGMIRVGENTGNLEENLLYVAEYYTEEIENRLQLVTSFLEPVLLLFMGLLVGFVAISIILPIYQVTSAVK